MIRGFLLALVLVVLAYGLGFVAFVVTLPQTPAKLPHADGIVALTGSDERLFVAASLLDRGAGDRLLITGADQSIGRDTLKFFLHGGAKFDCCVDIGYAAEDTHGNALETADWARQHGYKSLVLVTGRYHMPRTLREFRHAMPEISFLPYPVEEKGIAIDHWWRHAQTTALLHREYAKYLAAVLVTSLT